MSEIALAIHGGAGELDPAALDRRAVSERLQVLERILAKAYAALRSASALDVVELAVAEMEDFEGFNAGRGSVLTAAGTVEMDAAIMDGRTRRAGAVANVRCIKNPVRAARIVMEQTEHVLLAGSGAEAFCKSAGVDFAEPAYFITERRRTQLEQVRAGKQQRTDLDAPSGTVGAVARDAEGHLAAATSTGGMTDKTPGRIGDTPLIGAGTWADDTTCAVSATGDGEALIRSALAHEIDALLRCTETDLEAACQRALERAAALGGKGGCTAVAANGEIALPFNTSAMYRGWVGKDGRAHVAVAALSKP